jgi:hypothetical protein
MRRGKEYSCLKLESAPFNWLLSNLVLAFGKQNTIYYENSIVCIVIFLRRQLDGS